MSIESLAYIDDTGYHYADYPTILQYYKDAYRTIYGADVYLEEDSQDGQWIAIQASAMYDALALGAAVYNSYSPSGSQGVGLSRNVKINGIARSVPTKSSVDMYIVGTAGTEITDGVVGGDVNWDLPSSVIIPPSGDITVTAIAQQNGSLQAASGTINKIITPTRGWQSATNPSDAAPGDPVEEDAQLRLRQSISVALPSRTVLEGIEGAIASLSGVTRQRVYENDTDAVNADGIPEHSIAAVVEGGDSTLIAQTIAAKKTPGGFTFGAVATTVINVYGIPVTIRFGRPLYDDFTVAVSIKALPGYTATIGAAISQKVSDYINSVIIGGGASKSVEWGDALSAANSVSGGINYKMVSLTLTGPGGAGAPDVPLLYNHAARCVPASVVITVVP